MIKGISFTDTGNASISFGFNTTIHIRGPAIIMTSIGDRATFTFQEIGHSGADGKKRATEIIIWIAGTLVFAAINLLEPNISIIISLESHALSELVHASMP